MPRIRVLTAVLVGSASSLASGTPPTVEALLKHCAEKTIVVNRDAQKVGERLGGYCAAYLDATLDAAMNTGPALCETDDRSTEYLLSVFRTYLSDTKTDKSSQASKALLASYRRAFACAASKK